ncbi:MAG: hypothetical protein OXN83_00310 [Oligoflexia bacterium]|nr:hypothetical protein [Oligoflexia bacterium]
MEFLFGKKYPIFNKEGEIEHPRKDHFNQWKDRYTADPNKNWRNHAGLNFKETQNNNN